MHLQLYEVPYKALAIRKQWVPLFMKESAAKLALNKMPVTNWSLIGNAGVQGEAQRQALAAVIVQYSPALRVVLLKRYGLKPAEAEDFLQDFILNRVLEKEVISLADRKRGKFRTFLLTTMDHYVVDRLRKRKREAGVHEQMNGSIPESEAKGADPRVIGDAEWAKRVIQLALERMKDACEQTSRSDYWLIFHGRVVGPALERTAPVDYAAMLPHTGFKSSMEAMNALATAKRIFQRIIKEVVAEYIDDPKDSQAEVTDLLTALAGTR